MSKAKLDDNGSRSRRVQTDNFPRTVGFGATLCSEVSARTLSRGHWWTRLKEAMTTVGQLRYDGERRAEAKTLWGRGTRRASGPCGLPGRSRPVGAYVRCHQHCFFNLFAFHRGTKQEWQPPV